MSERTPATGLRGAKWVPLVETLTAAALVAWVGGMVALGAFAARIAFRDLPRDLAAPTMSTIFRSFDGVVVACVVIVAIATGLRLLAVGLRGRADRIALVAGTALTILGALDVGYVHPGIERMFLEGRTLEPAFAALHKLSSRSANLEAICAVLILGAHAWSRKRD
jgi:putative copper export protein